MGVPRAGGLVHVRDLVGAGDVRVDSVQEHGHGLVLDAGRFGAGHEAEQQVVDGGDVLLHQVRDPGRDLGVSQGLEGRDVAAVRAAPVREAQGVGGLHPEHQRVVRGLRGDGDRVGEALGVGAEAELRRGVGRVVAPHGVQNARPVGPPGDGDRVRLEGHDLRRLGLHFAVGGRRRGLDGEHGRVAVGAGVDDDQAHALLDGGEAHLPRQIELDVGVEVQLRVVVPIRLLDGHQVLRGLPLDDVGVVRDGAPRHPVEQLRGGPLAQNDHLPLVRLDLVVHDDAVLEVLDVAVADPLDVGDDGLRQDVHGDRRRVDDYAAAGTGDHRRHVTRRKNFLRLQDVARGIGAQLKAHVDGVTGRDGVGAGG